MATFINTVDGKLQVEIEPNEPQTYLPNVGQGMKSELDEIKEAITTYRGQPIVVELASEMTDDLLIYLYMGSEEGYEANHWYYYDTETEEWTDGGAYVANPVVIDDTLTHSGEAADAKVTGDELTQLKSDFDALDDYFVEGYNLFNPNDPDFIPDYKLNNNGTTTAETGKFVSGFIPIKAGKTICLNYPTTIYGSASSIVWYNAQKERIGYSTPSRYTDSRGNGYLKYTFSDAPEAAYMRVTGSMSGIATYMYVYASEMPSVYQPYMPYDVLSDDVRVKYSNVIDVAVSANQTDFIKTNPKNLNDLSQMVTGIFSNSTSNGNIDASVTSWRTSGFIPVKPGEKYSFVDYVGVYYGANNYGYPAYDKDQNFVAKIVPDGGKSTLAKVDVLTIPNNDRIAYIRTCYPITNITNHKRWYSTMVLKGSTWPGDAYIPYDGTVNLQGAGISPDFSAPYNCLSGKLSIWNGDSICAADNDPNGGWPLTIAKQNFMRATNYAIAGGTIAENVGSNVHSVSATLDGMLTDFPDADYIVFEGGTNDADLLGSAGMGTFDPDDFSAEYIGALDRDTFSGALESILYRLVTVMKGKHIGYIIPQKMGYTEELVTRRRQFFDQAILICKKWGVPYLDLWNNYYFNWRLAAHWDQTKTSAENNAANNLYRDGQHLTDFAYTVQSPVIAEWMKTI